VTRHLSRRALLGGATAGAASLALGQPAAARTQELLASLPACSGSLADIEHVIIFIQENRSFDHYFGRYKAIRGFDDRTAPGGDAPFRQAYSTAKTLGTATKPMLPWHIDTTLTIPPNQGQCTNDVEHQWAAQHDSWNGGRCDRWMSSHVITDPTVPQAAVAMGYYDRGDLPFYYALADNFTILDNYHCSLIGGTDANRLYTITATMDPDGWDGGCQFLDTKIGTVNSPGADLGTGGRWMPYPEVLTKAGVSWKVYGDPLGQLGDNVLRYFPQFRPVTGQPALSGPAFGSNLFPADFLADVALGHLPQVTWLLADLLDTEHAPTPIEWGESIVWTVLDALVRSGLWSKTAVLLTYDENGGFFDHVPPPTAPAGTPGEYLNQAAMTATARKEATTKDGRDTSHEPIGLGFRVPMLLISPFTRNPDPAGAPLVSSDLFDHTSMLKFLETWTTAKGTPARVPRRDAATRTPGLSVWRDQLVGDLTSAFNFAAAPDPSRPPALSIVPNRLDPKVLTECLLTGAPGSEVSATEPIVQDPRIAQIGIPRQEAGSAARRPSGVCVEAATATTTTAPQQPVAPAAAGSGRVGALAATGGGSAWPALGGLAAVAGAIALRRRAAAGQQPEEADHAEA
jgi:phospholipase C